MSLSVSSFARTYIFHPLSDQLSLKEKVAATVATVALAILLVVAVYYAGRFCYAKLFKKVSPSDTSKIGNVQKEALPIPKKAQPQFNSDLTQFPLPPAARTIPPSESFFRGNATLNAWLASQESQNSVKNCLGEKENVEAISTTINEQIEGFDREFQIKARFAALLEEGAAWFTTLTLTVWDLEEEFFPFALMMDAEIQKVTLLQVGGRDLTRLQERLEGEACRAKIDGALKVTRENFTTVPLVQLLNVNSESLKELLSFFPNWLLKCLPTSQIPKINVDQLSKHQLKLLFMPTGEDTIWAWKKTSGNLHALDPMTQLNEPFMFRLGSLAKSLTPDQTAKFVSKTKVFSSDLFKLLFPIEDENTFNNELLKKRLNSLDIQDILRLSDQFSEYHWRLLNLENFEKIACHHSDYLLRQINGSKSSLLDIYHSQHRDSFTKWIRMLNTQTLSEFSRLFNKDKWSLLTDAQVIDLTKSQPPLLEIRVAGQTVFQILYPENYSSTTGRLQKIPLDTVTRISPHFTVGHWGSLSLEQKLGVYRGSVVEQAVFNAFFPPKGNLLAGLPIETVLELCTRFEEGHWSQLSDAQVRTLTVDHIDKLNVRVGDKTVFQILYPTRFTGYDQAEKKAKIADKVVTFSHATLVSLAPQFTVDHWLMLLDDQVLELTRKQPGLLEAKVENKTVFEILYAWGSRRRIKELSVADISPICPLLQKEHWCELTVEKKTEITEKHQDFFDRSKVAFSALYPAHANIDPERYERISFEALMALSTRFEEGHWIQLSDTLVKRITEERTATLYIQVDKKTVFQLFYPSEKYDEGSILLKKKIQQFSLKVVGGLAHLFEKQHWQYIPAALIVHLVSSKPALFLSDDKCGKDWLFKKFITPKKEWGDYQSIAVSDLPIDSLLVLSPKFTEAHWKALSEDQLQALRKEHFDKLPEFLKEKN